MAEKKKTLLLWAVLLALMVLGCGRTETAPEPEETDPIQEEESGDAAGTEQEPAGDYVLSSVNATVDGGRVLRLDAIGQTEEGRCGIREVRVYEDGQLLQTISCAESGALEDSYTHAPSVEEAMSVKDMNFDGSEDLDLCGAVTPDTAPHLYWLWNSGIGQYLYAYTLRGAQLRPQSREIIAAYVIDGVNYADRWQYGPEGALALTERYVEDWDLGTEDFPLREYYQFPDGVETLIWQQFTDYDDEGRTIRETREVIDGVLWPVRREELEVTDGVTRVIRTEELPLPEPEIPEEPLEEESPEALPEGETPEA